MLNSPFDSIDPSFLGDQFDSRADKVRSVSEFSTDPVTLQRVLLNIVRLFGVTVKQILDGHDGDIDSDAFGSLSFITGHRGAFGGSGSGSDLAGSRVSIASHRSLVEMNISVRIKYIFLETYPSTLKKLEDILLSSDMDNELRAIIHNTRGLRAGLFVPNSVMEILIKRHILKLEAPALQCVDAVHHELLRLVEQILTNPGSPIHSFPQLSEWIATTANEVLESCKLMATQEVKRLIKMETAYINTGHPDFLARGGIANWLHEERRRLKREGSSEASHKHILRRPLTSGHKQGYLTKLGGTRKNWKKRWFVLKDATLSFFESESDASEKGSFSLLDCIIRDMTTKKIYPPKATYAGEEDYFGQDDVRGKQHAFEIIHCEGSVLFRNHRNLVVFAETEKEKNEWIRLLSDGVEWIRAHQDAKAAVATPPQSPPPMDGHPAPPVPPPRAIKSKSGLGGAKQPTKTPASQLGVLPQVPDQLYASDLNDTQSRTFPGNPIAPTTDESEDEAELMSSADDNTISLLRLLLHSYFMIVRKHIQDLVPKAIMLMMVNRLKNDLHSVLTGKILVNEDQHQKGSGGTKVNVLHLLEESEDVRVERQQKVQMLRMVRDALAVIDKDVQL